MERVTRSGEGEAKRLCVSAREVLGEALSEVEWEAVVVTGERETEGVTVPWASTNTRLPWASISSPPAGVKVGTMGVEDARAGVAEPV